MTTGDPWSILGIERTTDETLIRRAYARALKSANPEEDAIAFAGVRAAYESALAHARRRTPAAAARAPASARTAAAAPPADAPPAAPTAPVDQVPQPAGPPDDVKQLADAFRQLHVAASTKGSTPQVLAGLLDDCLRMPALEHMQTRLEFESSLAGWLWAHRTVPGVPILHAIERLKWRSATRVREPPQITAILRYADFLQWMESADFRGRPAFRALSRPPRRFWIWWNIFANSVDREVREAVARLDMAGGSLPAGWNADAVRWWRKHLSAPQPRTGLMRITPALAGLGLFIALATDGGGSARMVLFPLCGLLAGIGLTAGWYHGVDLPMSRRKGTSRRLQRWQKVGWAPATLGIGLLSGCLPDNGPGIVLVGMLAALAIGWCYWAIRVTSRDGTIGLTGQRLVAHVMLNAPLGIWWALMSGHATLQPTIAMLVATVACAVVALVGQRLLPGWHGESASGKSAYWGPVGLLGATLLSLGLLAGPPPTPLGLRTTTMVIVATVMAERALALEVLGGAQLKIRYYVATLPFLVLAPGLFGSDPRPQVVFRGMGAALLLGVAFGACLCGYALWQQRTARTPRGR